MNSEKVMILVFSVLAWAIYLYFDARQHEANLRPIKESVIAHHRPLVLHFYAEGHGPSRQFGPILKGALRPYGNTIDCQDLDIDRDKNRALLLNFGTTAVPTTVIFDRDGNQLARETGCLDAKTLDIYLRQAVRFHD